MSQMLGTSSNAAQIDYWNATAGETWAQLHELLDRQIEPLALRPWMFWGRRRASISSTSAAAAARLR